MISKTITIYTIFTIFLIELSKLTPMHIILTKRLSSILMWNKLFEIKEYFERKMNCSIYKVLPNVIENTFSQDKRQDMFNCTIFM
ncbi:hypothetical protein JOC70_003626 [Clostridium pascui]|nr:hypothetical protein [Clostridium pascui]